MKPSFLEKPVVRFFMIAIGVCMMTASYNFFFTPNRIAPGGFSGLGIVLHHQFGFPVGGVTLVLNVPLFILAWRDQGAGYILRSLAATFAFSLMMDLLPEFAVTDDLVLASVYGGGLLGVGLGLIVRAGCSTGGSDMMAKLLSDRIGRLSFGVTLFLIETVIVAASGFAFGPQLALYAVLVLMMSSKIIDMLQEGVDAAKAFFIITDKGERIAERILSDLDRGVTRLFGTGMYSGEARDVLLCVIHRAETSELKHLVREADPAAFMVVSDVREALGEGFAPMQQAKKIRTRRKKVRNSSLNGE